MSEITRVQKEQEFALSVPKIVGTLGLGKVMAPIYESIHGVLKKNNLEFGKDCMPFARYNGVNWEELTKKGFLSAIKLFFFYKWDLNIGITCPESIPPEGPIEKMQIHGGEYLRIIHKGPYQRVGDTYEKVLLYAKTRKIKLDDYSIEFYLNDPREVAPESLETEVLLPIIKE